MRGLESLSPSSAILAFITQSFFYGILGWVFGQTNWLSNFVRVRSLTSAVINSPDNCSRHVDSESWLKLPQLVSVLFSRVTNETSLCMSSQNSFMEAVLDFVVLSSFDESPVLISMDFLFVREWFTFFLECNTSIFIPSVSNQEAPSFLWVFL